MTRRLLAKLVLAAFMMTVTALPARAALITVTALSGVNLSFTATEMAGTIDFTFDSANLVSKANGSTISPPVPATFPDLILTTGPVTPITPPPNVGFTPAFNITSYGIEDFSGVVFDYIIALGTTNGNDLALTGTVFLDPASPSTTFTNGINTYDVSAFMTPAQFGFTFTDQTGNLINMLTSGDGSINGTANFSQFTTPEPSSIVLLGVGGLLSVVARRRRKA
jgi:hypothetical protein